MDEILKGLRRAANVGCGVTLTASEVHDLREMLPNDHPMPDEFELVAAMREHGGGFAVAIAKAWIRADAGNQAKLRGAFHDLVETYRQYL